MGSGSTDWIHRSVGYEIYIRSFADGDGNGIGDLRGIHDRLDHLAWLGVDVVWISPFYPSPMADFGYDVADYTDVDPQFGDLADFDRLITRARALGIKMVVDLVPNHTSSEHPWFHESRSSRHNPLRDRYIWRDPAPGGGPPNNWLSHFGGPAWTFDDHTGQYYLHLFLPEQPDLNWRSEEVRAEFDDVLEFWLARGVDGFRIDVAQALVKDLDLRDDPVLVPLDQVSDARRQFECLDHRHDLLQPETHEIFRRWRTITDRHDAVLIGETYVLDPSQLAGLVPGDGLHLGFWFGAMRLAWEADEIRGTIRGPLDALAGHAGDIGWVQSSHDESRPVARFGGGDRGRTRSLGLATMLMGLPGLAFLYQGEELGLDDAAVPAEALTDPVAVRNPGTIGRDACRTPMPWEPGPSLGFSSSATTWLPVGHTESDTVAHQRDDPSSYLHRMRELVAVRRSLPAPPPTLEWPSAPPPVVAYRRGDHLFALNVGDEPVTWDPGDASTTVFRTVGEAADPPTELAADEAIILGPA